MSVTIPKGEELEALIFDINSEDKFERAALSIFRFQAFHNCMYKKFCNQIGVAANRIARVDKIPFLPISFFKTARVISTDFTPEAIFESSGTTGTVKSKHYIKNLSLYKKSFTASFEAVYGPLKDYAILGLLPSYLEKENSSLIFMVKEWMQVSGHPQNGFFLNNYTQLNHTLAVLQQQKQKTILIGVTYALLQFAALFPQALSHVIVMETGGMKGKRKEQTREEVHSVLSTAFSIRATHSEYGMTELLSQAYAGDKGKFIAPQWMKIRLRYEDDPLTLVPSSTQPTTGIINIIDLANIWSCSFIATDDVGRLYSNGNFEVLGRVDGSDIRGCSLLVV